MTSSWLVRSSCTAAHHCLKALWLPRTTSHLGKHLCCLHSSHCRGPPPWKNNQLLPFHPHWHPNNFLSPKGNTHCQILWRATPKATLGGPSTPKRWEIPHWLTALKPNHAKAFSWDSNMVREARREYFSKHSFDFTLDGTWDLSGMVKHLAMRAGLLGTSIYKTQSPWSRPEELKQANYILLSLPKGMIPQGCTPSESPKVMGLMGIHDPDALCQFDSVIYCSWCGKEGQNKGMVVNHLWTTHYWLGLVCDRCYGCPSTMSNTLHCHGQLNCHWLRESIPSKSGLST